MQTPGKLLTAQEERQLSPLVMDFVNYEGVMSHFQEEHKRRPEVHEWAALCGLDDDVGEFVRRLKVGTPLPSTIFFAASLLASV